MKRLMTLVIDWMEVAHHFEKKLICCFDWPCWAIYELVSLVRIVNALQLFMLCCWS